MGSLNCFFVPPKSRKIPVSMVTSIAQVNRVTADITHSVQNDVICVTSRRTSGETGQHFQATTGTSSLQPTTGTSSLQRFCIPGLCRLVSCKLLHTVICLRTLTVQHAIWSQIIYTIHFSKTQWGCYLISLHKHKHVYCSFIKPAVETLQRCKYRLSINWAVRDGLGKLPNHISRFNR